MTQPAHPGLAEDLAQNRAGRLSPRQREVLDRAAAVRRPDAICWMGAVSGLLIAILLPVTLLRDSQIRKVTLGDQIAFLAIAAIFLLVGLVCIALAARLARRRAALRADLAAGALAPVYANVVWRNSTFSGDYHLEPADHSAPLHAASAPLPPGPYRVYALPNSRFVVSAESTVVPGGQWSIALADAERAGLRFFGSTYAAVVQPFPTAPYLGDRAELLRALAAALDFDAEDLGHNRNGSISPRQVRRRLTAALVPFLLITAFGQIPAVIAYLINDLIWAFALPILVALAVALWLARDIFAPRVEVVAGIVQRRFDVHIYNGQNGPTEEHRHYFLINGREIPVHERAFRALVPQLPYRLYFAARSRRLLSLDPLDASSAQLHVAPRQEGPWPQAG